METILKYILSMVFIIREIQVSENEFLSLQVKICLMFVLPIAKT